MAFQIQAVQTGQYHQFSAKEILALIGDAINDEILINGKVYRISSCKETRTGSSSLIHWTTDSIAINQNAQSVFYFPQQISDTQSLFLTVNNILYNYGVDADFHVQGDRLYWHGKFPLETDDQMIIRYPNPIN